MPDSLDEVPVRHCGPGGDAEGGGPVVPIKLGLGAPLPTSFSGGLCGGAMPQDWFHLCSHPLWFGFSQNQQTCSKLQFWLAHARF